MGRLKTLNRLCRESFRAKSICLVSSLVVSLAGFLWILVTLASNGMSARTEQFFYLPLYDEQDKKLQQAREKIPIKLDSVRDEIGLFHHTLDLTTSSSKNLLSIKELSIKISSSESNPEILSAKLVIPLKDNLEKAIEYNANIKDWSFQNNIEFKRNGDDLKEIDAPQEIKLELVTRKKTDLSTFVQFTIDKPIGSLLWIKQKKADGSQIYGSIYGEYKYENGKGPLRSKAQLLSYTWGWGVDGSWIIYFICSVGACFWCIGVWLLFSQQEWGWMHLMVECKAIAIGLLFSSACLIHAIISPPFQGPDEADHFLTYAETNAIPQLSYGALTLANRGHLTRIMTRPMEKFGCPDVDCPMDGGWSEIIGPTPPGRSPLCRLVWKTLGYVGNQADAGSVLLTIRILNGLLVGCFLAGSLIVACTAMKGGWLFPWLGISALLIPCISYYSTVVSNYPFLIAGYLGQVVVLGMMWEFIANRTISLPALKTTGSLLGISLAVSICSAENSMVCLPFWAVVLPGFLIALTLQSKVEADLWRNGRTLIISMASSLTALVLLVALMTPQGAFMPAINSEHLADNMLFKNMTSVLSFLILALFVISLFLTSCAGNLFIRFIQKAAWAKHGRVLLLAFFCVVFLILFLTDSQQVQSLRFPEVKVPMLTYVSHVVHSFFDSLFPGNNDIKISGTFWRRLGWLDTYLPAMLMDILRISTGVGLVLLIHQSLREVYYPRQSLFALANLFGLLLCITTIGVLYYLVGYNINSRYLIAAYLFTVLLATEGYRQFFRNMPDSLKLRNASLFLFCLCAIAVQSITWNSMISRYF